jgi:CheY-like chemotaxis protein
MEAFAKSARTRARPDSPDPTSTVGRPQVLVVDDDPVNLMVAARQLSFIGIDALLAVDGAEAVARVCEHQPDLVLMDIEMPTLDGFAATAQIRHLERELSRRRVPVVAHTSTFHPGDLSRLRASGFDAILGKPAGAQAMRECVTRWCSAGSGAGSPRSRP